MLISFLMVTILVTGFRITVFLSIKSKFPTNSITPSTICSRGRGCLSAIVPYVPVASGCVYNARMADYTLLVDETGIDGASKRVVYVGCLFETSELTAVEQRIRDFNQTCLDDPLYHSLVHNSNEPRHFVDDNESIRTHFINEVIRRLPCRVYSVMDVPKETVKKSKVELFKVFIKYVRQVREIEKLNIVVEKSGSDDKYLEECGAVFKDKTYLPLSIVDYYGAVLHRFHEARLGAVGSGRMLRTGELNNLVNSRYAVLVDRVSLERDLSTGEKSSRREGRYFLDQIKGIVASD